eukprot:4210407-Amphidinium_carterae.1
MRCGRVMGKERRRYSTKGNNLGSRELAHVWKKQAKLLSWGRCTVGAASLETEDLPPPLPNPKVAKQISKKSL